jgi:hypothetical protein
MQSEEFKGLSADILFKDCDKKLQCAREVIVFFQYNRSHIP